MNQLSAIFDNSEILIFYLLFSKPILTRFFLFIKKLTKSKPLQIILILISFFIILNLKIHLWDLSSRPNIYHDLGVSKHATTSEIKSRFRKLAVELHPDRAPENRDKYFETSALFDILLNPHNKYIYDKFGIIMTEDRVILQLFTIMKKTLESYSWTLQFVAIFFLDSYNNENFKVVYTLFLVNLAIVTYLLFVKDFRDVFDLIFPNTTDFQVLRVFQSNMFFISFFFKYLWCFIWNDYFIFFKEMVRVVKGFFYQIKILQIEVYQEFMLEHLEFKDAKLDGNKDFETKFYDFRKRFLERRRIKIENKMKELEEIKEQNKNPVLDEIPENKAEQKSVLNTNSQTS